MHKTKIAKEYETLFIGGRTNVVVDDINYFEAVGNYTLVHLNSTKKIMVATTLGKIENRSAGLGKFLRPHRSILVNACFVDNYDEAQIFLKNKMNIKIPRRRKEEVLRQLFALVG